MTTTHIMVDLETMGTTPGSVLCSIGAIAFDPVSGEFGARFYRVIDQLTCEAVGLTRDPKTVEWWAQQSAEAREALTIGAEPLRIVLQDFGFWWKRNSGVEFWAHGPGFDEALLAAAYRACQLKPPWAFWNARCTRTIYAAAGVKPDRAAGVHHNAMTDALQQARAVIKAYRRLRIGESRARQVWNRFLRWTLPL